MELERHPALYFEDGDILLSAYATPTSRQLYRVHRTFLSHYSEVFRGMFAVVSATDVEESYDGLPLLNMPDEDTADAVASLLDVMYDSRCELHPRLFAHRLRCLTCKLAAPPADHAAPVRRAVPADGPRAAREEIHGAGHRVRRNRARSRPVARRHRRVRSAPGRVSARSRRARRRPHPGRFFPEPASALAFTRAHDVPGVVPAALYALGGAAGTTSRSGRARTGSCPRAGASSTRTRSSACCAAGTACSRTSRRPCAQGTWPYPAADHMSRCTGPAEVCRARCDRLWAVFMAIVVHDEDDVSDTDYCGFLNRSRSATGLKRVYAKNVGRARIKW